MLVAGLLVAGGVLGQEKQPTEPDWTALGFRADRVRAQQSLEETFLDTIDQGAFRRHLAELTREPHIAGDEANRRVADYITEVMSSAGLEVEQYPYDLYMPRHSTATSEVAIVRPKRELLNQQEDVLDEDPHSAHPALDRAWNAYSGSGDVTSTVVYANYGRREDFDALAKMEIDVVGKVVLARYGGNFRGFKAKYAEEAGAAALLMFSDPADGGFVEGPEYPEGPFLNDSTVQRGSILTLDWPGDPLTPFHPAWPIDDPARSVARLDPMQLPLPKIPVTALPYGSAQRILQQMSGPPVPGGWQGGLPMTYRISGGEDLTVRVRVEQERGLVRAQNVVGTVTGSQRPDEWIILGSHYDAWGFGALDPNGGTAMLLSLAESLGRLTKAGKKPSRSILIAHWDAEEFGILGSSEWVEQMREHLSAKAVAYINADGAVTGPSFSVSAAPALKAMITETTKSVADPRGGTVYEQWLSHRGATTEPFGDLGGGSDHVGFYCHIGIPSAMIGFSGPAPVYHSAYDDFTWFERFADPDWTVGNALVALDGLLALRLANADLLPFDFTAFAEDSSRHLAVAERLAGVSFREARARLARLLNSAAKVRKARQRALSSGAARRDLSSANAEIVAVERAFIHDAGMPFGTWYRSLFAAPDPTSGYSAWMFPGLRWAAQSGDPKELERWEAIYSEALARVDAAAQRITNSLR